MKLTARAIVALAALAAGLGALAAHAATTDITSSPLEVASSNTTVKPNIMLLFDDSGSMAWDFMPDWIGPSPLPGHGVDKPRCTSGSTTKNGVVVPCTPGTTTGQSGEPPYYAYQFNGVYYNPLVYYPPGVTYTGTTMTSYTSSNSTAWTKVPVDAYGTTSGTINLVSGYPETVYCNATGITPPSTSCKRNGIDTGNPFLYNLGSASNGYPDAVLSSASGSVTVTLNGSNTIKVMPGTYENFATQKVNFFYYDITPAEYCTDATLTACTLSKVSTTVGGVTYGTAAPIRYCLSATDANSVSAVTGTTSVTWSATAQPRCQQKYNQRLGYQYPRFGYFVRNDIVAATPNYARSTARIDCAAAPTCTYAEEMTNIANWYAYYHARLQMAKTAVGTAVNKLTSSYRIGFLTINAYAGGSLNTAQFLPIADFNSTQKQTFYTDFYKLTAANGTPLREALSRVGQYYAGKTGSTALDNGMISSSNPDPVQYSCQQNYTILTTDGYWNGNAGQDLQGNSIDYNTAAGNQDNDSTNTFEQRTASDYGTGGYYDGNLANSSFNGSTYTSKGTLADVAMYYYKTDLRPAGSTNYNTGVNVSTDNVSTAKGVDLNPAQHMVTYTVGLGVDGYLTYDTTQLNPSANSVDFQNIVKGTVGACVWTPGNVCDWPQVPTGTGYNDDPAKDDDLWHAAVNGRGAYLSAKNPQSLLTGLTSLLTSIQAQVGAAAASATSTPNITLTNNSIYSTTFRTAYWDGEMVAQTIDPTTGIVNPTINWSESAKLEALTTSASDSRTIYTQSGGVLVPFKFLSLDSTAKAYFSNRCSVLSQCSGMSLLDQAIVNSGTNLVNYLRGQSLYADGTHFRTHTDIKTGLTNVLGDLVDSRPAVVNAPLRHYSDAPIAPAYQTYATYAANNATRTSVIYVGGNDGMLHAFDATSGNELWAYVPRVMLAQMYGLADTAYATQHRFYVDGSPTVADVLSTSDGTWHTILVGGYDAGGRGYFAFDVTVPTAPKLLWEICSDSATCTISDANLGLTFGNPVITKRAYDGHWVVLVTSGYNNVTPAGADGMGHLYELDPFAGTILTSVSTGVGSTTTPAGLSRITALANNPDTDNTSTLVWGGDLQGNLWRFNLGTATPTVSLMATLKDSAGKVQPITTRPEVGIINGNTVVFVGTGRLLGVSDLQDPATLSPAGNWSYVSTQYALLDNGSNLGNPRTNPTMVVQTLSGFGSGSTQTQRSVTTNAVSFPSNIGWLVDFPTAGERVNVDPQIVLGVLIVTTNIPNTDACSAGGNSWLYQFDYTNGSAVVGVASSVVGTETVGALTVGNVVVELPNSTVKIISTLSNGTKVTSGLNTNPVNTTVRRVGWRSVAQ